MYESSLIARFAHEKVLKLIRYTAKLVLATSLDGINTPAARALSRFEASVGSSRCLTARIHAIPIVVSAAFPR